MIIFSLHLKRNKEIIYIKMVGTAFLERIRIFFFTKDINRKTTIKEVLRPLSDTDKLAPLRTLVQLLT